MNFRNVADGIYCMGDANGKFQLVMLLIMKQKLLLLIYLKDLETMVNPCATKKKSTL